MSQELSGSENGLTTIVAASGKQVALLPPETPNIGCSFYQTIAVDTNKQNPLVMSKSPNLVSASMMISAERANEAGRASLRKWPLDKALKE